MHYFARRGSDQRGTGLAEIGPLTTDAAACVVKLDRDDKVIGAFAVEGTTVRYRNQCTSATR